ncbi:MAG TPA: Yip1 family protein [Oligoflexia bacterium]|nr:Yip1 family protein [Oligoflexia bacterium]
MNENQETPTERPAQPAASSAGCAVCGIDWQRFGLRAKDILLDPKGIWEKLKSEEQTIEGLFRNYGFLILALPVIFKFLRMVSVGIELPFGVTYHWPFIQGVFFSIVSYFLQIIGVFLMALIIEKLAPRFSCSVKRVDALKLVVYSLTPASLTSVFYLIPGLGVLLLLGGLYSLYLFYQGFGCMTGVAQESRMKYFGFSLGASAAAAFVVFLVLSLAGPAMPGPEPKVTVPKTLKLPGNVNVDTEQLQKGLNQLEKTVQEFQKSVPASGD